MNTGNKPAVVGVCGLIGSGKSMVSRLLRLCEIPVYDCDMEARRIMDNDSAIHSALQRIAGDDVVDIQDGRGRISRNLLAERMFSDETVLAGVNALIHRRVREDFSAWLETHEDDEVVGVECAIIVTSGMETLCDMLWIVDADEDIRVKRIVERNATTAERARQWMAAQYTERKALEKSSGEGNIPVVRIDNNGGASLLKQVYEALAAVINRM